MWDEGNVGVNRFAAGSGQVAVVRRQWPAARDQTKEIWFASRRRARYIPYDIMDYSRIITIVPGKRSGKPCIRSLRITVHDVLEYLASGMSHDDVLRDFPYLTEEDIRACLAYAAEAGRRTSHAVASKNSGLMPVSLCC